MSGAASLDPPRLEHWRCRFCGVELRGTVHVAVAVVMVDSLGGELGCDHWRTCAPCGRIVNEALQALKSAADAGAKVSR